MARLEQQLAEIPQRLERLHKSRGEEVVAHRSGQPPSARARRITLGYTATLAVSEDQIILAQRVAQDTNDNEALLPMVEAVRSPCRTAPRRVSADTAVFSLWIRCRRWNKPGSKRMFRTRIWRVGSIAEDGWTAANQGNSASPSPHAAEVAGPRGPKNLPATESDRRTGVRSVETTTRDAAIRTTRFGAGGSGAGDHCIQSHAPVAGRLAGRPLTDLANAGNRRDVMIVFAKQIPGRRV